MPPLRSGRASKACLLCRRYKTRCYASETEGGSCLRCQTLAEPCSLQGEHITTRPRSSIPKSPIDRRAPVPRPVEDRLDRLERTVGSLVDRLDARLDVLAAAASSRQDSPPSLGPSASASIASAERNPAPPVFLIRDAATDAAISPSQSNKVTDSSFKTDVISSGLVSLPAAYSLLELFHTHYSRWVKFPEDVTTDALLLRVRTSPLLLCSILLIAVRHSTQDLADDLAPALFHEAKQLVAVSLLEVPRTVEFFQAVLILSLWSTTIGQEPLSIDSWLLTGYALQQGLASPVFADLFRHKSNLPTSKRHFDAWCLWNHLCLAHLQYCVDTQRQTILKKSQVDHCLRLVGSDSITNYEMRMAAEVKLYWIIHNQCCSPSINMSEVIAVLQNWQQEWAALFNQPRSQFLQMGFHFAHLLAYYQSLKSLRSTMGTSTLSEMVRLSKTIINLAIDTSDDRTRHLTDHIYHVVTFSALTLIHLLNTSERKIHTATNHSVSDLDALIIKLVRWLRSIGLSCHVSHLLSDVVQTQFEKFRKRSGAGATSHINSQRNALSTYQVAVTESQNVGEHMASSSSLGVNPGPNAQTDAPQFPFLDMISSELFGMEADITLWPQWDQMASQMDHSV
ncbi:hypothetical protein NLU13_7365 [Sarocladium strictum]|uniref:Transcriptional activator of proteases prtT n=1 Tax=Sarocladium strictum TaxID=5046 RepID=A0AA39L550_SARSR|nr:hypothetical protein NLU13_7365 [Sarocladium strictum]